MLIISFDSVGDSEFARLAEYPAFSAFHGQSAVFRAVSSLFLSNTYPVHTSVATGVAPGEHGVLSNTEPFPSRHPVWNSREAGIRAQTLWQAAAKHGVDTAAVFWPVTAYSKTIRYNIPEVLARPGKSQLITSLRAGSARLQLKLFLRHRALLDGIRQPNLDNFATACMADILREHRPGLALIHLTAYDALCHEHGKDSGALETAFEALDRNLGILLEAAGNDRDAPASEMLGYLTGAGENIQRDGYPNQVGGKTKRDFLNVFVYDQHLMLVRRKVEQGKKPKRRRHLSFQVGVHWPLIHFRLYQQYFHFPSTNRKARNLP
jgi:hypothetical protein